MRSDSSELIPHISDPQRFEDALATFLREHEANLPLQEFCKEGSPSLEDWAEYEDFDYEVKEYEVNGSCMVRFDESLHRGCRDIDWSEKVSGRLDFVISIEEEIIEVTAGDIFEREPDET